MMVFKTLSFYVKTFAVKEFKCDFCEADYFQRESLARHIKEIHPEIAKKKAEAKTTENSTDAPVDAPKKETPKAEEADAAREKEVEVKKEEEAPAKKEEIETIKIERKKITGPTVLGKIELPVEKPKSSGNSKADNANKRKRKRIKKVETPAPGAKGGNSKFQSKKPPKAEITEKFQPFCMSVYTYHQKNLKFYSAQNTCLTL